MSRTMMLLVGVVVGINALLSTTVVVRCDDKLNELAVIKGEEDSSSSETVGGFAGGSASATDMGMITIPTTAVDFVQSIMLNPYGLPLAVDAELEDGMMAPGPEPMMADDRARVRRTTVVRRPIAPGPTVRRTTVVGKRHLLGDDDEDEDDDEDHDDHDHDHDHDHDMTAATNAAKEAMMEEFSDFQDAVIDPMVEELAPSPDALFADDRYFRRTTVVRRRPITGRRVVRRTTVIG